MEGLSVPILDPQQTDHEQTDREQHRLAEKGKLNIFLLSPEPSQILPKPSLCDKITATKLLVHCQFVRGQLTWLANIRCVSAP